MERKEMKGKVGGQSGEKVIIEQDYSGAPYLYVGIDGHNGAKARLTPDTAWSYAKKLLKHTRQVRERNGVPVPAKVEPETQVTDIYLEDRIASIYPCGNHLHLLVKGPESSGSISLTPEKAKAFAKAILQAAKTAEENA